MYLKQVTEGNRLYSVEYNKPYKMIPYIENRRFIYERD